MQNLTLKSLVLCGWLTFGATANAQPIAPTPPLPPTTPYGPPITLEQAKKVADAAMAEASKRNMKMAIVEPAGDLVYFQRMDGTQYASIQIAQDKAKSAAISRRSRKDFFDRVAKGDMSPFALRGALASAGGIPILVDGKIIGAIGTSGGADDAVSQAGANAVK
jgi:uncharacterized protein GlcG (DUF336 family)